MPLPGADDQQILRRIALLRRAEGPLIDDPNSPDALATSLRRWREHAAKLRVDTLALQRRPRRDPPRGGIVIRGAARTAPASGGIVIHRAYADRSRHVMCSRLCDQSKEGGSIESARRLWPRCHVATRSNRAARRCRGRPTGRSLGRGVRGAGAFRSQGAATECLAPVRSRRGGGRRGPPDVRRVVDDTDIVEAGAQPPELRPAASSHELACAVHGVWFVGARRVLP
jgi:hypothetical protein